MFDIHDKKLGKKYEDNDCVPSFLIYNLIPQIQLLFLGILATWQDVMFNTLKDGKK